MSQWAAVSLLLLCCGVLKVTGSSLEDRYRTLVQASEYHLQELRRNVEELHLLKQRLDLEADGISRRSLEGNLLPSLLVFCDALGHPGKYRIPSLGSRGQKTFQTSSPASTNQSLISTEMPRIPPVEESDRWEQADPEPLRVEVSEVDGDINMTFEVRSNHSYKVIKITMYPWSSKKEMKRKKFSGQVSFFFSQGRCSPRFLDVVTFLRKKKEFVSLVIDMCQKLELAENSTGKSRISEDITIPQYKLLGQNWEGLKIEDGQNATIDLEVNFNTTSVMSIEATINDTVQDKFLHSELTSFLSNAKSSLRFESMSAEDFLLQAQELNPVFNNIARNSSHGKDGDLHSDSRDFNRKIRIILNTASGHISGYLILFFTKDGNEGSLVSQISRNKIIALNKADQKQVFPRGRFYFQNPRDFDCQLNEMDEPEDCVVYCSVMGRGITNLTIRKQEATSPETNGVPKSSLVEYGLMSSITANLGPSNESLHGEYICEVTDRRGVKDSMPFKVNVVGHPKVDKNMTQIMDFHNGSVLLTCVGTGSPPLNATIYVDELTDSGRVEPDFTQTSSVNEFTDEISTSAVVPTTSLQWPKAWVHCRLENSMGVDEYGFYIVDHLHNYYGS